MSLSGSIACAFTTLERNKLLASTCGDNSVQINRLTNAADREIKKRAKSLPLKYVDGGI